jgi:aminoglycoside phosphotransferase (APT) family kinase protein
MAAPAALTPPKARAAVASVVKRHFGERPGRVQPLDGGLNNTVFSVRAGGAMHVVRLHAEAAKVHDYLKEQWAMEQARGAGVPTPHVLEVGNDEHGHAYMIVEEVPGACGAEVADRLPVLQQLGRCAALLHQIPTSGFGPVFDWSSNRLSKHRQWARYLDEEMQAGARLKALLRLGGLPSPQARSIEKTLQAMRRWRKAPVLQHGDLRLKNVIVDPEDGRLRALIDWEDCLSAPGPYWDLSIALHDLGPDEREAFLDGYGLSPVAFERAAPFVRALNLLNYAAALQAASEAGQRERLAWMRARLRGAFDMTP